MELAVFATSVLVGALTGALAGLLLKRGGRGLKTDIVLGLVGSIGVSWVLRAIELISGSGLVVAACVGLVGSGFVIVAQRTLRPAETVAEQIGEPGRSERRVRP